MFKYLILSALFLNQNSNFEFYRHLNNKQTKEIPFVIEGGKPTTIEAVAEPSSTHITCKLQNQNGGAAEENNTNHCIYNLNDKHSLQLVLALTNESSSSLEVKVVVHPTAK